MYRRVYRGAFALGALFCLTAANVAGASDWIVPISASSPQVIVSLTDERKRDDSDFFAANSVFGESSSDKTSPIRVLPTNGPPHYGVFVYDTGAPAHILSYATNAAFDITLAGRRGTNIVQVGGSGGDLIDTFPSDPLAIYAAGFGAINSTTPLNVDTNQLRGQYNVSVLTGDFNTENPEVDLPNLLGTPMSSQYTTVIEYSRPHILDIHGTVRRSPDVSLLEIGSAPRPTRRLGLSFESGQVLPAPAFIPDLGNLNINDLGDNPSSPTNTGWFFLDADVENNGVYRSQLEMLFDTGSQGTFVSEQVAATMGFDVELDEPDFVVRVASVTGISEEVPGFIAETFTLPGTGGGMTLPNVPLIVFNITDPRDAFSTLPGLIGMNLFADRDLIINPEPGNAYLGVSDPVFETHSWSAAAPTGQWTAPESWTTPGVPAISWNAVVRNTPGAAQRAVVAQDSTVGALNVSGTDGTMTVEISNDVTLEVFGAVVVQDGGRFEVRGTLDPLSVEIRRGEISGVGHVGGEVLSQGDVVPGGVGQTGVLTFRGSFDQLHEGTMLIELNGVVYSDTVQQYDRVVVEGASTIGGMLELTALAGYSDPTEHGVSHRFIVLRAEEGLIGTFDDVVYQGQTLEGEFSLGRSFRDHVGDGLFRSVTYSSNSVVVSNFRALVGDADGDGQVQFSDFTVLSTNFGKDGDWTVGDFTGDGRILFADFLGLSANFGEFATTGSLAAIPEPSTWALAFIAALACTRRRGLRRGSAQPLAKISGHLLA